MARGSKTTSAERVLQYMRDTGSISTFEAFSELGVARLSARIYDLKAQGHHIISWTETKRNRYGDKVSFSVYKLEE